ncbi:hypothetical protein MJK72_18895 [Klebsiella pneumoniae]|nr:hypothetical protein MJK72_18895 [Klebsiella pneumoniae]
MTLDIVMADDPSPSAAMPDEHESCLQLALLSPEQAQLDELEATWRWLEARAPSRGSRLR